MHRTRPWMMALAVALTVAAATPTSAQLLTLPPDGNNEKASVSQWIGLVEVNITYNAP